jgi:hypothetical protein
MNDWLKSKQRRHAERMKKEWGDFVGHDRAWWAEQSRKDGTDRSSLLRQRIKMWWWVRLGRPPLREFLRKLRE